MKTGKVYLVGAGPGDPGLITKKGVDCLSKADVVIYDYLLDTSLLAAAPRDAEKIFVGKTPSKHTREQAEINQLLIVKAKQGKTVVRLKGGDPFVFGRGGEEAESLAQNQVPFEVVPGVSSAVAVPAYAGIPVTHRRIASSFAVITGHEDPHKTRSRINWKNLATGVDTLVFLMGMQNLPEIVTKLVENSRPTSTPVAVIKDGTRPDQKVITGTLKNIVQRVNRQGLKSPAIIIVGKVVRLREKLRWFDNLPLYGKSILVTRARHQASSLSQLLSQRGALPVELPAIEIKRTPDSSQLDHSLTKLEQYDWIIFTSVNGVEIFFERLRELKLDTRALKNIKVAAIGPATATALEQKGIFPDFIPSVYTIKSLVAEIGQCNIASQRFLLPRAEIADRELTEGLVKLGAEVHEVALYTTVQPSDASAQVRKMLASEHIDVITFTSSSTVSNFITMVGSTSVQLNNVKIACIGPKTAETASRMGLTVDIVASEHTIPGLVAAIESYYETAEKEVSRCNRDRGAE